MILKENKKHTKHTALIKPIGGEFHSNEWAILGAPCGIINEFAKTLATQLSKSMKVGYIDASHQEVEQDHPYQVYYQDKIKYAHLESQVSFAQKQNKKYFRSLDLLLINGNHFLGDKQIIFINEKKKESLKKKLDRLKDLRMVIVESRDQEIHNFIKPLISDKVKIFEISELEKVATEIQTDSINYYPTLNGLVLAGGKSKRMGQDKGALEYYGKAQREYEADLLSPLCKNVYLSYHENQVISVDGKYPFIKDTFTGLGPYGAILSAFREFPNQAWLTIACDLPLLNQESLELLVQSRNPSKLATCFHNPETKFPEPLITIWEPRAYPVLLEFLGQGYSCPRKVLINTEIEEVFVDQIDFMENANDPKAFESAKEKIKNL